MDQLAKLGLSWIIITFLLMCDIVVSHRMHPMSDEFIDTINSNQNLWTAGRNFHRHTPMRYFKRLMGSLRDNGPRLPVKMFGKLRQKLPVNFDARQKWPNCPTLQDIRDQGSCGSCWAVSTVSAISDRICIESNGRKNFYFSDDDVLSCCTNCGEGCDGGVLVKAWTYYVREGIVSGGHYNSTQGCRPYVIPPCEHNTHGNREECGSNVHTPRCDIRKCTNNNYKTKYSQDKHRGKRAYRINKNNMKQEIFFKGPLTTSFSVYEDFLTYQDGIYNHTTGKYVGEHAVKVIGWGIENGVKYWLVANSWNTDWGQLNGFFKYIRGSNSSGFEENAVGAVPRL